MFTFVLQFSHDKLLGIFVSKKKKSFFNEVLQNDERVMVSFRIRKSVIKQLKELTELFNKRTKMKLGKTAMLEMIIMNETRIIINEMEKFEVTNAYEEIMNKD